MFSVTLVVGNGSAYVPGLSSFRLFPKGMDDYYLLSIQNKQ